MAGNGTTGGVVASPTYMADIRFFFRPLDIEHMATMGIELGTYEGVKKNALAIYAHTAPPNPSMPPPEEKASWSADQSQTFKNWIINGCPLGSATPQPVVGPSPGAPSDRVRKSVSSLSAEEITTLTTAFKGLMQRDPKDPTSYFALAGLHGLPQSWCLHHEDRFNPWHRVYIKQFEDQLRSISGCEELTLPYWDVTTPLPELLQQPPFASYVLPEDPGKTSKPPHPGQYFPYTTRRYPPATIAQNMQRYGVYEDIATSLLQSLWGAYNVSGYQDFSIQAHDGGHVSIGPTMADQNVASYDPVFWFYHCNIDRLWLKWQQKVGATTLAGFESTLAGDTGWLRPPFNGLEPFTTTTDETIAFGISYDEPVPSGEEATLENKVGSIEAAQSFSIGSSSPVSVRVKGIDRLNIPGSFAVNLLADGEPIASRAFFQPKSPQECENCRKHALINIDFRIDRQKLVDRKLSVEIEVPGNEEIGARFPLSQAGNPSVNARLLLDDE
jgi:tyrosinase